jgi:hypothetical protein
MRLGWLFDPQPVPHPYSLYSCGFDVVRQTARRGPALQVVDIQQLTAIRFWRCYISAFPSPFLSV